MKARLPIFRFVAPVVILPAFAPSTILSLPKKHTIFFGDNLRFHYSPDNLEVIVGDTIEWKGDFTMYRLRSTIIPPGAKSFSADSVPSFSYVVTKQGEYDYQNPIYASIWNDVFKFYGYSA